MYKYSQISGADKEIKKHLDKIIDAALGCTEWNNDVHSLVLFGAYGKGEGGFVNDAPVNDYDILLMSGSRKIKRAIEKVKLPVTVEVWQVDKLPEGCTQQWFEVKYASKHLAGKELELPDWNEYDIPFSDAINSLNRRVLSMLVGKYEMTKDEPDTHKIMTQIGKMVCALGDAILIKRGQFNPYYRTRLAMLNDDDINSFYAVSVSHKLFGTPELNKDELWSLWDQVREYFRQYVITNQIHTDFGDMLINYDERIEPETLKGLLEALGAGDWL